MKRLRWAVIGATGIANTRTIPEGIMQDENSLLVAVMSHPKDQEKLKTVAATYGDVPWFTDVAEMLRQVEADACYIASPPAAHLENARACAEVGLHVFCEKPLARTVVEAEEIVRLCRGHGVKLGTAFMLPYHHLVQEAMRLVREGAIGRVIMARAQFGFDYPPIPGAFRQVYSEHCGGAFMDVGNHATDLLERIVGSKVASVMAAADNLVHQYEGVEDSCVALYRLQNGAMAIAEAYFCTDGAVNNIEITGGRKTLMLEGVIGQEAGGTLSLRSGFNGETVDLRLESDGRNMYLGEISAFARAVLDDTDPPISGEDGLWSQKVVEAVYRSARERCCVEVQ